MNVHQIEVVLAQKASSASTNLELLQYTKALQLLKTNGVFVVKTYGSLPAAASNEGKIYFIEDIETVVWSNGTSWLRMLDKNTVQFQLFSWGLNSDRQLGDGTATNRCSPVREFCSATDWSQTSSGERHSAAVKTSGQIWAWGYNYYGQLGDRTRTARCSPVREISSSTDWRQVSAGRRHTAAVKTSGQIFSWGDNNRGNLGDGTVSRRSSPTQEFCSATDWCQVSAGYCHTTAIKTSGQIWSWGINDGSLGDGTNVDKCSPVRELCSGTNWCQVNVGDFGHTLALKTSGELWGWGPNAFGQLGNGCAVATCSPVREITSSTNWCQVDGGRYHSAAIKTSGQVWTWGENAAGRLGNGTTASVCSPIREFCSATDWSQVSAGFCHTAAVKTTGQLWSWGCNANGRLGDGTETDSCSPVREFSSAANWSQSCAGAGQTTAIKFL